MMQIARNVIDADDGFLRGKRYLILDRDAKYSDGFRNEIMREGVAQEFRERAAKTHPERATLSMCNHQRESEPAAIAVGDFWRELWTCWR